MNILYLDGVGPFGGASRSLFEAVTAMREDGIRPYFLAAKGTALDFYSKIAVDVIAIRGLTRFDNTQYSYYRGLRWLVLLRELFHLPFTIFALEKAARKWKGRIDLIHVNEVTEIVPGLIAKMLFGVPMIVHVRSPQRMDNKSWRTKVLSKVLSRSADAVVAINDTTRATLPDWLPVDVVQNSFTAKRSVNTDPEMLARLDALRPKSLKVGFVGNLQVAKGLFDLLDAAKLLRDDGVDVEFVVVGGHTREDAGIKSWLLKKAGLTHNLYVDLVSRISSYGIAESFHLLGATADIQCVYERLDVITFPSHYDAPGRPIFEAAFSSVPCIVCVSNPKSDTIVHGETGLAIPARDPKALAQAIRYFESTRSEVRRMGENARQLAIRNFDPQTNAVNLKKIYERVLRRPGFILADTEAKL
jgi:glycosyltransferase involved in cell wall biosynthesis